MLLFQKRFHEGLVRGAVTLTFRRWPTLRVKVGGRYRCHPIGVLEVDGIQIVRVAAISEDDARRAGFDSVEELRAFLADGPAGPITSRTEVHRIELHHAGDGDRVPIALETRIDETARAALDATLDRLDAKGAWTRATLRLIRRHPRVAASKLAAKLGRETAPFKADVVKLKRLGLTQSFEVGYELSPRGVAYLDGPASRRSRPQ